MALENFEFEQMELFSRFNRTESSSIVHLHNDDGRAIVGYGGQQGLSNWRHRDHNDEQANNAARSALLLALGKATRLLREGEGYEVGADGRTRFTRENFIADLKSALGKEVVTALNMDGPTATFKMENGYLVSGRPLTERRISRLMDALYRVSGHERPADEEAVSVQDQANARYNNERPTFEGADANFIINYFKDQVNCPSTGDDFRMYQDNFRWAFTMTDGAGTQLAGTAFHVLCSEDVGSPLFERALTTLQQGMRSYVAWAKANGSLPQETEVDISLATLRKLAVLSKEEAWDGSPTYFQRTGAELPRWKRTFNLFSRTFSLIEQNQSNATAANYLENFRKEVERQTLRRLRRKASPLDWIRTMVTSDRMNSIFAGAFPGDDLKHAVGQSVLVALGINVAADMIGPYANDLFGMVKTSVELATANAAPNADDGTILAGAADRFLTALQQLANENADFKAALPKELTLDDALNGLVATLFAHNVSRLGRTNFEAAITHVGGGMPEQANFTFRLVGDEQQYDSHVNSVWNVFNQYGVVVNDALRTDNTPPLTGLSKSELTVEDSQAPLITFSRFGSVGSRNHGNVNEQYRQLAAQTFLLNPRLVKQAAEGAAVIDVPIFRVDMGEADNLSNPAPGSVTDTIVDFVITFTPPIADDADGVVPQRVKVTLRPKVVKFRLPTDSVFPSAKSNPDEKANWVTAYEQGDKEPCEQNFCVMGKTDLAKTQSAMDALSEEVARYLNGQESPNGKIVSDLWTDVQAAFDKIKAHKESNEKDPDNGRIRWYDGFGADMHRLGARIALLVSKLGHVPAINCNWGRDRTGAMDNEIKMLAVKLHKGEKLGEIVTEGESDGNEALRKEMLEKTGNAELANCANCTVHPINLNQSRVAGIPKLVNMENVVTLKKSELQSA